MTGRWHSGRQMTYVATVPRLAAWIAGCILGGAMSASLVRADTVVTACASDDQERGAGFNLADALQMGGTIRFACPAGTTIRVTGEYSIDGAVQIEGDDLVILEGSPGQQFLSSSKPIALRHIMLRGFVEPPHGLRNLRGGSALIALAGLELDHVRIEASVSPVYVSGEAKVRDSTFTGNSGSVLVFTGPAEVTRSRFENNELAIEMGEGSVADCEFKGGTEGGVRLTAPRAPALVLRSTFSGNRGRPALLLSQQSGQGGSHLVSVRANTFRDNDGTRRPGPRMVAAPPEGGGAIGFIDLVEEARRFHEPEATINALTQLPPGRFVFAYNHFENNRGDAAGAFAADIAHTEGLTSVGDIFIGNTSGGNGGAVSVSGGALQLTHALIKANHASSRGAALFIGPVAKATIANSLVIGNVGPAGTLAGGLATIANVTIADNQAAGLALDPSSRVVHTILARNTPSDCAAVDGAVFQGVNAASDGSCPGLAPTDAALDTLYVPTSNQALAAGDATVCRAAPVAGQDLAFQARSDPVHCALGAFERAPAAKLSRWVKLPEVHATPDDIFTEAEGYRPPPSRPAPGSSALLQPAEVLAALQGLGVDFSVKEADLRDWLSNAQFTPYPAMAQALLALLRPRPLRQPVYFDVIVWNYEHTRGVASPRKVADVDQNVLKEAILEGYNGRHAPPARSFEEALQ
jgi:hypothetical protein